MKRLRDISIRAKIITAILLINAGTSAFIYLYFPPRLQKEATNAIVQKGESIASMTAYSLAPAIAFDDPRAVEEVFETAKQNTDLVYLVVCNEGERIVYGYNTIRAEEVKFRRTSEETAIDGIIYKTASKISVDNQTIGTLFIGLSLEALNRQVDESKKTVAVVSVIVFSVGFLVAFGIGSVLTRPLRRVVETVEQIAGGNMSERAEIASADEVGVLAASFNRMVDTVAATQTQLEEMNRMLEERVRRRTSELQRQIDEHERTKDILLRRELMIGGVAAVSEQFLRAEDWESSIESVLQTIGVAAGVSRVYVFRNAYGAEGNMFSSQMYEWCAEGISRQMENPSLKNFDLGAPGLEQWMQAMSEGTPVSATLSEVPDEYKGLYTAQGVRSAMLVPIFVEKKWWGFIGCDECRYERKWMPAETDALTTAARNLGAAIERGVAMKALSDSEMRYRTFFDDDLTGDFIARLDGRVIDCNAAFIRMFGFSSVNEALETDFTDLFPSSAQRDELFSLLREKKILTYHEISLRRRDRRPVFVIANLIGIAAPDGELEMVRGYLFDDTRRKELEQQLLQAQKLESIGTLAGGIAHDFNNILAIILGYTEAIMNKDLPKEKVDKNLQIIAKMSARGVDLVRQLLAFARKTQTHMMPVNINEIVADTIQLLEMTFPKSITIIRETEEGLPQLLADSTQLHQVLLNLCVNARDAIVPPGIITVGTRSVRYEQLQRRFPKVYRSPYIELFVADTGEGMPREMFGKIFEPFFTTKKLDKGTGLGLAVVFGIVESHKGIIDVESEPGEGTTFHIYFPVQDAGAAVPETAVLENKADAAVNGTVLLVEDEEDLRLLTETGLDDLGFRVLTAADGEEALLTYERHAAEIDLVLSDFDLPKLNGEQLFGKLRQKNPAVKMIIASGFLQPEIAQRLRRDGIAGFIEKPYDLKRLSAMIASSLS